MAWKVAKFDGVIGADYYRGMTTFISQEGLLEIPEEFRKADALKPGQRCDIERLGNGEYRVRVAAEDAKPKQSFLDWLLACPEKDWFLEPNRSERTTLDRPTLFDE